MTRISRREMMRVGGLSLAGLSLPSLLQHESHAAAPGNDGVFGRAKNIIFLYLNGGPPQHETFDPKPHAPAEIRGPFQPIKTNIPGMNFCELLPRTAAIADKLAVVRSMATDDNIHSSSGHWVLTGSKYQGPNARTIQSTDWPFYGSLIKRYVPSQTMPALSTVMIPDVIRLNENVTPAGQSGGLMGPQWTPERFIGDPSRPDYKIQGLEPLGITADRLQQRRRLQDQLEDRLRAAENSRSLDLFNTYQRQAYDLLTSGKARKAFSINRETADVRDRYGRNRWGQCLLLARRLVEAGVRLVHVNWPREPGDNAVDNPLWDTHAQNHDRVEDVLCPIFDVGFSALIEDLDQRGLLDETLVVAIGEFGRTPKINPKSGRDHWGPVFSFAMAGAGISGGQVYGSSDKHGAYPKSKRVEPGHLTATIFHLVGLDHRGTFTDPSGRELSLTKQSPMYELLGTKPATDERIASSGSVDRVPVFDEKRILQNTDFSHSASLKPVDTASRPKGWRYQISSKEAVDFGVTMSGPTQIGSLKLAQHVVMGLDGKAASHRVAGDLLLAQEVRSPFAGTYRMTVELLGEGDASCFQKLFGQMYECQLLFFQFTEKTKRISARKVLAATAIAPQLAEPAKAKMQRFEFTREFANPQAGANFSFGLGLGVGLLIRAKGSSKQQPAGRAVLRVASFELDFLGKELNPDVTV